MLPNGKEGRADYMRYRNQRTMHRELVLEANNGDMAKLIASEMEVMTMEAELSGFREQMDFLISIGGLTPQQVEALQNVIGWADTFLSAPQSQVAA